MNKLTLTPRRTKETGSSLIEVLVTIMVLSLGLLGMAGLQVSTLKMNQSAGARSTAAQFAYSALDKVRSRGELGASAYVCSNILTCTSSNTVVNQDLTTLRNQIHPATGHGALPDANIRIYRRNDANITATTDCRNDPDQAGGKVYVACVSWNQGKDDRLGIGENTATSFDATQMVWAAASLF